jgi:hypothetical protein
LRTFGSTLILFLFICGIPFIRVICGSLVTILYGKGLPFRIFSLPHGFRGFPWLLPQDKPRIARINADLNHRCTQITADVVSLHLRHPIHLCNLRFPWQRSF